MPTLTPTLLSHVAEYFKVLSELSRLQVLCAIKTGPKNVTEIMAETELGQANVSKHLKILTQAGLISRHPRGVSVYYELSDPMIFDLCTLVCQSLEQRLQRQSQQLSDLNRSVFGESEKQV